MVAAISGCSTAASRSASTLSHDAQQACAPATRVAGFCFYFPCLLVSSSGNAISTAFERLLSPPTVTRPSLIFSLAFSFRTSNGRKDASKVKVIRPIDEHPVGSLRCRDAWMACPCTQTRQTRCQSSSLEVSLNFNAVPRQQTAEPFLRVLSAFQVEPEVGIVLHYSSYASFSHCK